MGCSTMSNRQGKLSISFIVFLALLVAVIPFFSVITSVPKALAVGENWLTDYDNRVEVGITENGGGTMGNYSIQLQAYYNAAPMEADGCTQFLNRPAFRYNGTHDRTYMANHASEYLEKLLVIYIEFIC